MSRRAQIGARGGRGLGLYAGKVSRLKQGGTRQQAAAGTGSDNAHHLFDELLGRGSRASIYDLNCALNDVAPERPAAAISLLTKVPTPNLCTYSIVIGCCRRVARLDLAFATFGRVIRTGWKVDAITFNPLLKGLCESKRIGDAIDIALRRMPELGCTPDAFSYTILLKGLCDDNRSQQALDLLRIMMADDHTSEGCPPDVVSYSTVINGFLREARLFLPYARLKQWTRPLRSLLGWLKNGVVPDYVTYSSLVHGYCSSGKPKGAIGIFKRMCTDGVEPDVVTYSTLMDYLCKNGRSMEAKKIFDSMVKRGHKPDITTYGTLLHGYATQGCLVEMCHLLDAMVRVDMQPDHRIFNILIGAYAKHGKVDEAMLLFSKMRKQGLKPNVVSYGTIMDGLYRVGRVDDAMSQYNSLISEGLTPDAVIFSTLIHGLCTCDRDKVEELAFETIDRGIHPDTIFFNTILGHLCKEGWITQAQKIFDLMVRTGVNPDVITYSSLMDGYCLDGKMDEAMKLLEGMVSNAVKPDVVTYNTLVNGYCKNGRIEDALALFKQMASKGVNPNIVTYRTILHGLFQAGRTAAARELYLWMIKSGIQFDIATYNIILHGLCQNNCTDDAFPMFQNLQNLCLTNFQLETSTFNIMIGASLRGGRRDEAKNMFASLLAKGLVPDVVTYGLMMKSFIDQGLLEQFDDLFVSMEKNGCTAGSRMLNALVRRLLQKGEVQKAGVYLSKIDQKNFSLEVSTTELLIELVSGGNYDQYIRFIPGKYLPGVKSRAVIPIPFISLHLTMLHLCGFYVDNRFAEKLFCGCPVLQDLELRHCAIKVTLFSSATLKSLTITIPYKTQDNPKAFELIVIDMPNPESRRDSKLKSSSLQCIIVEDVLILLDEFSFGFTDSVI
uniref:Uncharacterized protein n=1 Tax=Leersia perrieri TaxID=77586 RepID=A0A0D9X4D1_9ORYZ